MLVLNKDKLSQNFVSKSALEKVVLRNHSALQLVTVSGVCPVAVLTRVFAQALLEQEAKTAGFKSEVSKAQDMHEVGYLLSTCHGAGKTCHALKVSKLLSVEGQTLAAVQSYMRCTIACARASRAFQPKMSAADDKGVCLRVMLL